MHELRAGLWHWRARHPQWTLHALWPEEVSSYAIDDGARLLLFDPLAVPDELFALAADREPIVVLTAPWHERDARLLVERLGAPVFTPRPDTADDLVRKFGITLDQAGDGSPDLAWLLREHQGEARPYAPGDRLSVGVDVFAGREPNDTVLWVESHNAVIAGDTLVDRGNGLEVGSLRAGVTRDEVVRGLQPLLALPVDVVLPAHGAPTDRAALEHALSATAVFGP